MKIRRFALILMSVVLSLTSINVSLAGSEAPSQLEIEKAAVNIFDPIRDAGELGDHVHGSSIVELPNGELLSVWFQGNGERDATTTRIMGARSLNGGKTWMEPFEMADSQGIADINPVVYLDEGERLWFFWYPVLAGRWETSQPKYAYAEKGSYEYAVVGNAKPEWTWSQIIDVKIGNNIGDVVNPDSPDDYISPKLQKGYVNTLKAKYAEFEAYNFKSIEQGGAGMSQRIYGKAWDAFVAERLKLAGGDPNQYLYAPTVADSVWKVRSGYPLARRLGWQTKDKPYVFNIGNGKVRMLLPLYSDTMEHTMMAITEYDPSKPLEDNSILWTFSEPIVGVANIQASMAQKKDGTIVAYMRDNGPAPKRVVTSESKDGGFTWTIGKDVPELIDPGVGHDLKKLSSGDWVFVHVDSLKNRNSLAVALSDDEGKTWKYRRHLVIDSRANTGSYHYPAVTEAKNGDVLISFTHDFGAEDKDAKGNSLNGFNNIMFARLTSDWIKQGDWTKEKDMLVYDYENLEAEIAVPLCFDMNTASDKQIRSLLPSTIKGYLTYGNGAVNEKLNYVELPIKWDIEAVKSNFALDKLIDKNKIFGEVDLKDLPKGIKADQLPGYKPTLKAYFYQGTNGNIDGGSQGNGGTDDLCRKTDSNND